MATTSTSTGHRELCDCAIAVACLRRSLLLGAAVAAATAAVAAAAAAADATADATAAAADGTVDAV
eukprot:scaffold127972_cov21-Phaeocystis_antarctica.AAC.1